MTLVSNQCYYMEQRHGWGLIKQLNDVMLKCDRRKLSDIAGIISVRIATVAKRC